MTSAEVMNVNGNSASVVSNGSSIDGVKQALGPSDDLKQPTIQRSATSTSLGTAPGTARDPLAGHYGHLTEQQESSLNAFKALLFAQGLYSNDPRPSHDDPTLLRYLRARRWDPSAALKQFKEAETWRTTSRVDDFFVEHDIESYEHARRLYPCWTGRRTKRGLPYYIYRVNDLDKKALHHLGETPKKRGKHGKDGLMPVVALYEALMQLVLPLSTKMQDRPNTETPITTSCNIVDISGVSLMQFLRMRGHLGDASALATSKYPETLDSILVIGAPPYVETVFQFISQWFDANTRAKISILGTDMEKNLARLSEMIDPADLPKCYGGQLDWNFGELPNLDPKIEQAFGLDKARWPIGPIKMEGDQLVARGTSKDGKHRHEVIGTYTIGEATRSVIAPAV